MSHRHALIWIPPALGLVALTGGFGVLPPRIEGLGSTCGDYCGGRLVFAVFPLGLLALGLAAIHLWDQNYKTALAFFLWSVSVVSSGFVNDRLDQDPLAAWLNWKSPFLDYDPEWGHSIENHEQIYRDGTNGRIYAGRGA
ncbi:MAG: hypothetical protein IT452_17870 [Planctomycetia bacterium]|nr:hypothetical protein [Planctomycetia bacterium]